MQAAIRPDSGALEMSFSSLREAHDYLDEACRQSALVVALDRELQQYESLDCVMSIPGSARLSLPLEVLQVFPSKDDAFQTALRIPDPTVLPLAELRNRIESEAEPEPDPATDCEDEPEAAPPSLPHAADISPTFRIRQMNPSQRFRLAMKATRTERQLLLRDNQPQVLVGLLANPRLEDAEVLEIVKSNFASAGVMQRVAKNRKWMQNRELQLAIVRNPKTPTDLAQKLLPNLGTNDLRQLAKMGNARETLRKAALRAYLQRTSKRPFG